MTIINFNKVKKEFNSKEILSDVSFNINDHEKIGIIGTNGTGKSTILNLLTGETALDRNGGAINYYKQSLKIGYLFQSAEYKIINYEKGHFATCKNFTACKDFTHYNDNKSDEMDLLKNTSMLGLKNSSSLGLVSGNINQSDHLSGGEKTKIAIAALWASNVQLLILDEPTNNMDFKGINWLINEIPKFKGIILIVSHDRYFLDKTVSKIIEVKDGTAETYEGNYSFYKEESERRYEAKLKQYNSQEKYKHKIEEQIASLENWSEKAHRTSRTAGASCGVAMGLKERNRAKAKKMDKQVKSRIKRLQRIEINGINKPQKEKELDFQFSANANRGSRIIEAKSITKTFEDKLIFKNSSFTIGRNEKIGVIGPNGCGKSTLLNILMGNDKEYSGDIWVSENFKTAYMSQNVLEKDESTTIDTIIDSQYNFRMEKIKIFNLMSSLGLNYNSLLNTPFNKLSYGERVRAKLAFMISEDPDIIIMDEPTNHLDLYSRERLEEILSQYEGTILFVSHDRYALEKVCNKLLIFKDKKIIKYEGKFEDYMTTKNNSQISSKEKQAQKLLIETKLAYVVGKISQLDKSSPLYPALDEEFNMLLKEKNLLR